MVKSVEFLIIGQGLAGTAVSWRLHQQGRSFIVIDQQRPDSPSRVAAGLINPVTGRNLVPTWRVNDLLPIALDQYREMDQFLGIQSLHEVPAWRFFERQSEVDKLPERLKEAPEYLTPLPKDIDLNDSKAPLGVEIKEGGWLDTELLLDGWRAYLIKQGSLGDNFIQWNELSISTNTIRWKDIEAQHLILCPGYLPKNDLYFPNLPFSLTKGEILTVSGLTWPEDKIYMYQYFMVPIGNGQWRLGATYNWKEINTTPTGEAKAIMLNKWKEVYRGELNVIDHRAGIRPSTIDRMPLLGTHDAFPNLHLLTGLGSKGAIQAPWLGEHLLQSIDSLNPIMPAVKWNRKEKPHTK